MTATTRRRWLAFFVVLSVVLFAAFLWARPLLNIGAGYAAKHACSCHFFQGRELDEISEHDLNFSVLGYASLATEDNWVRASFLGLTPRVAVFKEGIGCTLINDELATVKNLQTGAAAGARYGRKERTEDATELYSQYVTAMELGMGAVEGGGR